MATGAGRTGALRGNRDLECLERPGRPVSVFQLTSPERPGSPALLRWDAECLWHDTSVSRKKPSVFHCEVLGDGNALEFCKKMYIFKKYL